VGQLSKSAIAVVAVLSVCAVLITPALDELPSALPHAVPHAITSLVPNAPVAVPITTSFGQPSISAAPLTPTGDPLSLMCIRLC
jgi:hypothetical protein